MIQNYQDFCKKLLYAGFSLGSGGNDEGVYSLLKHKWDKEPSESNIRWHTGDPETDPWEWRIRVLDERDDIAYAKVFFRKSGYITKEWYPCFLAARRGNTSLEEAYAEGTVSNYAKRIYDILCLHNRLPVHLIKQYAGFIKEDNSKFDRALTELQMRLFITMCGKQQKVSQTGEKYGWASTMFCTAEEFWGDEIFDKASKITENYAVQKITEQISKLNPDADRKKIIKFIHGR